MSIMSRSRPSRTRRVGEDPAEFGRMRTFKKEPGDKEPDYRISREAFQFYLAELRMEMRKCLDKSERYRDIFWLIEDGYQREQLLAPHQVDARMKINAEAMSAQALNAMYDRWAMKYAEVIQAEVAYADFMGWGK